jgi:uncharacterized protein
MFFEIFLFLASILTSTISAIVGAAGGVVLLACMTLGLPVSATIPIHGLIQLLSNSLRAFYLRKNIIRSIFGYFCIGAPMGAFTAYFFITGLPSDKVPLLFIVAFIFYMVFKPKTMPQVKLKPWQFGVLGLASGFMGILVGATGPLLAPFFLRDDFSKEEIISTQASCQMVTHFIKIPVFLGLGFKYLDYHTLIILMFVGTLIGTTLGVRALKNMDSKLFVLFYKIVLVLVATKLLVVNIFNLV